MTVYVRNEFDERVEKATGSPLRAQSIDTIQVNIGLTCDLACRHCHVESSPKRKEQMDWETILLTLSAAKRAGARTIDITGGAPEMNPHFRRLVRSARDENLEVIVRTNLTIMGHDGYQDLPEFYRDQRVHLVASLPCYSPENVSKQRGLHVYDASIAVIKRLNAVGYGINAYPSPKRQRGVCGDLKLDLVYNPVGPALPPDQIQLEVDYRRELHRRFGIKFTRLIAMTNMPIGRFLHDLRRDGGQQRYMQLLRDSFNPQTLDGLMCRFQVHVSWDGTLHDCDFNYACGLPTEASAPRHIRDFNPASLVNRPIVTRTHCLGCTAGHGSSCGGALA
ncbi:MAG: arsenosugar biosynthesis radical SAM (seleno)protein ArsS [Phycisphaerae bacterium]